MCEKILLHACCAPCATVGTAELSTGGWKLTLYFYGGNIHPKAEWNRRLESLKILAGSYKLPLIIRAYSVNEWEHATEGLEKEPEGGIRCDHCIHLQLEAAAREAQQLGIGWLCTSLTLSPQKHPDLINEWGSEICERYGLRWLERVWRKKGGFAFSISESRRLNLYRQNYCGCRFSFRQTVVHTATV